MSKNLILWLVIGLTMMSLFNMFNAPRTSGSHTMSYSEFMDKVDQGSVEMVTIQDKQLTGQYRDAKGMTSTFVVQVPRFLKQIDDGR